MQRPQNEAGFSLVEALVALAVFALAGVALVQLQSQSVASFARVETRTLADVLAQNILTETIASRSPPRLGAQERTVQFAEREWQVNMVVAATPDPSIRRISVAVGAPDSQPYANVTGFMFAPGAAT